MLALFDVASPNLVVAQRDVTTVPAQSLYLMNSPLVVQQSKAFAQRLQAERRWMTPPVSIWPFGWPCAGRPPMPRNARRWSSSSRPATWIAAGRACARPCSPPPSSVTSSDPPLACRFAPLPKRQAAAPHNGDSPMSPSNFPFPLTRRQWLQATGCGFGYLALAGLAAEAAAKETAGSAITRWPRRRRTSLARAKRVIFLYMQGAPSHVDTFDYKPQLAVDAGKTVAPSGDTVQDRNLAERCCRRRGSSTSTARAACRSPSCSRTWPGTPTTCACSTACTPTCPTIRSRA